MTQEEIIEALQGLPAATLSEVTAQPCDLPPLVRCMVPGARMVGPAFTVRCPLGDNTAVTRAVDQAPKGSVIVIDCGGPPLTAVWGETASFTSQFRGVVGCVTNGAIRDIEAIIEAGFPAFAAGLSLRGSVKGQPGEINVDIVIGDIAIRPGDYMCGDADGVVVVARDRLPEITRSLEEVAKKEAALHASIENGNVQSLLSDTVRQSIRYIE